MAKNPRDEINKAAWNLVASARDTLGVNLTLASRNGQIDVKGDKLERLLTIVNASIEEGYSNGSRTFGRTVNEVLTALVPAVAIPVSGSVGSPPKKRA